LATTHATLVESTCYSYKYCYLWKGGFSKQNAIKNHLWAFVEIRYFGCFDENFIIQHWDGQYELNGGFQGVVEHEKS
jgi:hypothetical protein